MSAVAVCTAQAASPAYTYQIVAKTGDVIGDVTLDYVTQTSISNDGTVLIVEGQPSGTAILSANFITGKQSVVVPPITLNGYPPTVNSVKRNDRGEIVYDIFLPLGGPVSAEALYSPSGPVAVPGDTIQGFRIIPAGSFALNDAGKLAFDATLQTDTSVTGIFTPHRLLVKSGDKVSGVTLTNVSQPALDRSGMLAFQGSFSIGSQTYSGIFSKDSLVIKSGDTVNGSSVFDFQGPVLSKFGVLGYTATLQTTEPQLSNPFLGIFIDRSVIARTGEILDGVTVSDPYDLNGGLLALNEGGEALFFASAINADGTNGPGLFTAKHAVVATDDIIAGLKVQDIDFYDFRSGSMNDRGQISFVMTYEDNFPKYAVIVATPVDGTPLPINTSYKMQDRKGNIIDLGWALHPAWGAGSFAYLYPFNSGVDQQMTYTADGKLQSVADPNMYLYNDAGHLALGDHGDTFVIEQKGGAFTVKDGAVYLDSPHEINPPHTLAFTPKPAMWNFINASPTGSVR